MTTPNEQTKSVIVASTNPVKLQAVQQAFQRMMPDANLSFQPMPSTSGVPSQPRDDAETRLGAFQRAQSAMEQMPHAHYWVGIEGGIQDTPEGMYAFAWVVIRTASHTGQSRSASFLLPEAVADYVRSGLELGDADDRVFGVTDSKRNNGAIGLLTGNVVTRSSLYEHAVVMALVPFKQPELYPPQTDTT